MHCQSCVTLIEKALNKKEGIEDAVVNLTTEKATVEFNPEKINDKEIIEAINKRGYAASFRRPFCHP